MWKPKLCESLLACLVQVCWSFAPYEGSLLSERFMIPSLLRLISALDECLNGALCHHDRENCGISRKLCSALYLVWSNIYHSLISIAEEVFQECSLLFWGSPEANQQHSVVPRVEALGLIAALQFLSFFSRLEVAVWDSSAIGLSCTALVAAWQVNPVSFPPFICTDKNYICQEMKKEHSRMKKTMVKATWNFWSPVLGLGYCILLSPVFLIRLLASWASSDPCSLTLEKGPILKYQHKSNPESYVSCQLWHSYHSRYFCVQLYGLMHIFHIQFVSFTDERCDLQSNNRKLYRLIQGKPFFLLSPWFLSTVWRYF